MSGEVIHAPGPDGGTELRLQGTFGLTEVEDLRRAVRAAQHAGVVRRVDLSGVIRLEGSAASVLVDTLGRVEPFPVLANAGPDVGAILDLYTEDGRPPVRPPRPARLPLLVQIGRATLELDRTVRVMFAFVGSFSRAALGAVRRPSTVQWRGTVHEVERHGADGLPIVAVIGSLMGLISAFQAAIQLTKFGADTFVANLVALSLTRELAPLMTAIVVAGRSGAAIAAELGTMKVSEEIDALHVLGISPYRYLVIPRVLALVLVVPLLTLVADVLGILAGAVVTTGVLEVGLRTFVSSVQEALVPADVIGGLVKAAAFGALIGGLAAERGLSARGGAEGVGRATTSAVVAILFWLVLVDALFAVLFDLWGVF